ncbi:ParB N-terminal domain-containing protein [uncultured Alistipes sp.]|uniref:ParB N-terminal domain-containing protein n=1 Tax=uncultured Alistipes sp. TaxID=538949 RepID=UPI003220276D
MQINIDRIQVNSGRREALPDAVRELADSISAVGLLNPITVDRDYILIAGLHRLEAAKLLGWAEIECNVSSLEGLQAELAEIDENFVRADLETVEFGKLLLRRKKIYEMLHPQTKRGGDRKSEKIKGAKCAFDSVPSFVDDTAEKLGLHRATVKRQIQIAKNLTPETKEIIQDTDRKIRKKDLLKLSRMEPEQQEQAAAQLASGEIKSADEFPQAEPPKPSKPPEPAHEPEWTAGPVTEPPASSTVPYSLGDKHYDTLEESIADLKNPDKDCSYTPDTLLADIDGFVQTFHKGFAWYHDPFCTIVFPHISKVQFEFVRQRFESISSAMADLLNQMERTIKT